MTRFNLLRCQLAVCGLLSSICVMPMKSVAALQGGWPGPESSCYVMAAISSFLDTLSCWTIVQLSVDKYNTISGPHQVLSTIRGLCLRSAFVSLAATTLTLMTFMPSQTVFDVFTLLCAPDFRLSANTWTATLYVVSTYYVSVTIVLFCYVHILKTTHSRGHRVASLGHDVLCRHSLGPSRPRYASLTVVQIVVAFCVCYIPYMSLLTYQMVYHKDPSRFFFHLATSLHHLAPTVNAFVYGVSHRILRTAFCDFLRIYLQRPSSSRPTSMPGPSLTARVFTVAGLSWTQDEVSLPIVQSRPVVYNPSPGYCSACESNLSALPTRHSYPN